MRISVTLLDQFRLYQTEDWLTEASLLASIRGEFVPTPMVKAGMAYEKAIQEPGRYRTKAGLYAVDGFTFSALSVESVAMFFDPSGIWQAKETLLLDVSGEPVTVVAKVDHAAGNGINELKTRWSGFDCEKYMDAHQWRWYLIVFGAAFVQYTVVCMKDPDEPTFESIERFRVYPYPGMREDCTGLLHEFVDYVRAKGLEKYLADNRYKRESAA